MKKKKPDPTNLIQQGQTVFELPTDGVIVGWRARGDIDQDDIKDLAEDIKKNGQMQPIVVRPNKGGGFALVAGRRRTLACAAAGIPVKCILVKPKDIHHAIDLQISENLFRQDFDLLELGEALKKKQALLDKFPAQDSTERFTLATAKKYGRSEGWIRDVLMVADFSEEDKQDIREGKTPQERNKKAREKVSKKKKEKKKQGLKKKAEEKQAKRKKESAKKKQSPRKSKKDLGTLEGGPTIRVFQGDFATVLGTEETITPGYFDLCLTDPPYGLKWSLINHKERSNISEDVEWDQLDVGWVHKVAPFMAGVSQFLIFSPLEMIGEYKAALEAAGFTYRTALIWHKSNPGVVHRDTYLSSVEAIIWATRGKPYFLPWDNAGTKEVHNCFTSPICAGKERVDHPTQKPIKVIQRLLQRHSTDSHRVLDPFMGVGTTPVTCKMMGRVCVGMELEEAYFELATLRLEALG